MFFFLVHRQSGCDTAKQPSGDRGCDEENPSEFGLKKALIYLFERGGRKGLKEV